MQHVSAWRIGPVQIRSLLQAGILLCPRHARFWRHQNRIPFGVSKVGVSKQYRTLLWRSSVALNAIEHAVPCQTVRTSSKRLGILDAVNPSGGPGCCCCPL